MLSALPASVTTMTRTTIRLTDEQFAAVKRLAAAEDVSVSDVIRRSIDAFVDRPSREKIRRRVLGAAGALRGGPRDLSTRHDHYFAEALEADLRRNHRRRSR